MSDYSWCEKSILLEDVKLKTYFSTSKDYYFGDPNSKNVSDFDDPQWQLSLPKLSFNTYHNDWSEVIDIKGNEVEFGSYYKAIIENAYKYGHDYNSIRHYFWMRSSFVSERNNVAIGFPWYDTASEFSGIYRWIIDGKEGDVFSDIEQGWQMEGIIRDNTVYLLEADDSHFPVNFEKSEIFNNVSMKHDKLKSVILNNKEIVKDIIQKLSQEIGVDVWTKYHYKEDLKFGTKTWKPKRSSKSLLLKRLFRK